MSKLFHKQMCVDRVSPEVLIPAGSLFTVLGLPCRLKLVCSSCTGYTSPTVSPINFDSDVLSKALMTSSLQLLIPVHMAAVQQYSTAAICPNLLQSMKRHIIPVLERPT